MNMLVVDKDEGTRKLTKSILKELNPEEIFEASEGLQALKMLNNEDVDMIVSDWDLVKTSGLDLLNKVRNIDESSASFLKDISKIKNMPFILVLDEGDRDRILQAINAKVSQCIVRPFTADGLLEKVREVLKRHE